MFKRILGTVVEAIARRKPAVPPPLPRRSRPAESAGNANASANAAGPVSRAAEQRLATATLTDTARLVEMTAQTDTRAAALARLAELAAGDGIGDLLLRHPELEIELLLASHDAAYAERTLSTVTAAQTLIRVATHAQTPRVRQLAAARITSATDLVELERSSRGHDKAVHRAAKAGLDALRRQQAELADHGAALQQLRERVLQLQRSEHDPLHNARLDHLQRSFAAWQQRAGELTAAAPDSAPAEWVTQDISAALAQASERAAAAAEATAATTAAAIVVAIAATAEATTEAIAVDTTPVPAGPDGLLPATASPAAPEAIAAAAPVPAPDPADADQLQEYAQAIADLDAVLEDVCRDPSQVLDRLALVPPALQLLHRRWSAVSDHAAPPAAVGERFHDTARRLQNGVAAAQRFEQVAADITQLAAGVAPAHTNPSDPDACRRLSNEQQAQRLRARRAQSLLRDIAWPDALPGPALLAQLQSAGAAADAFVAHCDGHWQTLQAQLATVLDALEAAVDGGGYRTANGHLGEARRLLRCIPNRVSAKPQARCTALAARVQEMRDWQDFATHPKREALCASMEALVTEDHTPESRADRIKALRAAWHDLGPLTSAGERALFERFNTAADLAFAPSRVYFEEQSRVRATNLSHRKRVCATLEDYVANNDWSRADWKVAQQVLGLAREEFLTYSPVDRGAGREVGKRFDAAADALHAVIKAEWERNVAIKERIVAEAAQLSTSTEPASLRIERAKALQHEWRGVGATPRGPDQKMWKLFRAHCDAVFVARDEERINYERATQSDVDSGAGICAALEACVADPAPIASQSELHDLRARFEALTLTGDNARRLQRRFRDGEHAYLQRLRDQQHVARRHDFLGALRVHDLLARFEREPQTLNETALTEAIGSVSADLAERLAERLANLRGGEPRTDEASLAARQRWTIYAEILAELESPPAEQPVRLQLQVSRLAEGLGRRGSERLDLPAVLDAWVGAGADLGDPTTAAWRARLEKAIDAYLG